LIVGAKVESNEGQEMTLIIEEVTRLDDAVPLKSQRLSLTIPADGADERFLEEIFALLSKNQGKCDVNLRLCLDRGVKIEILSQPLRIQGSKSLENDLSARGCQVAWHLKQ
jgi:hypothetical protein